MVSHTSLGAATRALRAQPTKKPLSALLPALVALFALAPAVGGAVPEHRRIQNECRDRNRGQDNKSDRLVAHREILVSPWVAT